MDRSPSFNSHSRYNFQEKSIFSPPVGVHNISRYLENSSKIPQSTNFHASSSNNMSSSFKNSGRSKLLMNDATIYCTNPEYEEERMMIIDDQSHSFNGSNSFVQSSTHTLLGNKPSQLIKRPHVRG